MPEKELPKIYLATPAYNRRDTIERTIRSVVNQPYQNWTMIITDDGSTDDTAEVVKPWLQKYPGKIKYFYKKNGGLGSARNAGIEQILADPHHADADIVIALDSDDELHPNSLSFVAEFARKYPGSNLFIYGASYADGRKTYRMKEAEAVLDFPDIISGQWVWGECIAAVRLQAFYDPSKRNDPALNGGDGIVWWSIARTTKTVCVDRLLRIYHVDAGNTMSRAKMNKKFTTNLYDVNKRMIEEFGQDFAKYNPRALGVLYYGLARMAALIGRRKEAVGYLGKALCYAPADPVRLGMALISLIDSNFMLNNWLLRYFPPRDQ